MRSERATSTAVGNVERKVAWTAAAGALLLCALVAALLVAFQLLEPRVGVSNAVALDAFFNAKKLELP